MNNSILFLLCCITLVSCSREEYLHRSLKSVVRNKDSATINIGNLFHNQDIGWTYFLTGPAKCEEISAKIGVEYNGNDLEDVHTLVIIMSIDGCIIHREIFDNVIWNTPVDSCSTERIWLVKSKPSEFFFFTDEITFYPVKE